MSVNSNERLMTSHELADYLKVSKATIQRYCSLGLIKPDIVRGKDTGNRSGRRLYTLETANEIRKTLKHLCVGNDKEIASMLTVPGMAESLNVSVATAQKYVRMGLINPDVVLPSSSNSRSGVRKFKQSSIEDLRDRLNEADWKARKCRKPGQRCGSE